MVPGRWESKELGKSRELAQPLRPVRSWSLVLLTTTSGGPPGLEAQRLQEDLEANHDDLRLS